MTTHVSTIIEDHDEKIELFLACRKLKNMDVFSLTDPQIKVYIERKGEFQFFDQTENIQDNLNPNFTKTFLLDYVFEVKQTLKFEVLNVGPNKSELCGTVQITLGEIAGSKNMTCIQDIINKGKSNGKLIIKAEKVRENHSTVEMEISGKSLMNTKGWFGKSNPILKICRMAGDSGFVSVYESERVKKDLNPDWKPFELRVRKLCNGDYDRPIKAEVYSRSGFKETQIGECQFTISELQNHEKRDFTIFNNKKNKKAGNLHFNKFRLHEKPGFLDYLRGGTQLAVMVAVDFTGSNGDPVSPDSLHAFKYDGSLNEYQRAIMGVCDILLHYDSDKKVPMFGFGGKPRYPNFTTPSVSHCFSMTGDQGNPWAYGLDGIMQIYANTLQHVELSGPTLFSPVLQTAMKIASQNKQEGSNEYTILLILTDGEIHDMEQTINCLIKSAQLPLSVIIIGVGKADFTNMIILDGDDGLFNSEGVKAERDLVQFVPFREFQGNSELLAKRVLEEIPTQVVEYYTSMNILPRPPQYIDVAQLLRADTLGDRFVDNDGSGGVNDAINDERKGEIFMAAHANGNSGANYKNISFYPNGANRGSAGGQNPSPLQRAGTLENRPKRNSVEFVHNVAPTMDFSTTNKFNKPH